MSEGEGEITQTLTKQDLKDLIEDKLIATGLRHDLKEIIKSRLHRAGWEGTIRKMYIDYIKERGGGRGEHVNVSNMIAEMKIRGVEAVPESVRREIEELLWSVLVDLRPRFGLIGDSD